jgi:hypothetical protein
MNTFCSAMFRDSRQIANVLPICGSRAMRIAVRPMTIWLVTAHHWRSAAAMPITSFS